MDSNEPPNAHEARELRPDPANSPPATDVSAPQPPAEAAAKPQPSEPLAPEPERTLSDKLRALMPRSPFRDVMRQVQHNEYGETLFTELGAKLFLDAYLIKDLATSMAELDNLRRVAQSAVDRQMLAAARDILDPDFLNFYPPAPGALEWGGVTGLVQTAYGKYMEEKGRELASLPPEEVIAAAIAKLAAAGRPEEDLREHAFRLAPEMDKLEQRCARLQARIWRAINMIISLIERREARAAARAKAA